MGLTAPGLATSMGAYLMKKFGSMWLAGVALVAIGTGAATPAFAQSAPAEGASADEGTAIIVTG